MRVLAAAAPGVDCIEAVRRVEELLGRVDGCVALRRVPRVAEGLVDGDIILVVVAGGEELKPCRDGDCASPRVAFLVLG